MHLMLCWCTQRTYETITSNLNVTINQCQQSTHFWVAAEACKVRDKRKCVCLCARVLSWNLQYSGEIPSNIQTGMTYCQTGINLNRADILRRTLNVQSCKLYNKYMIVLIQLTHTEIFAYIGVLVFKSLSRKVLFIKKKGNRNC